MLRFFVIFSLFIVFLAKNVANAQIFNGVSQQEASLKQALKNVKPGSILILGENHGLAAHRDQHIQILSKLREKGFLVSVGFEFLNYTDQNFIEQYKAGILNESAFLSAVQWKGFPFEFYKQQLDFPSVALTEKALGLNLSRLITSKISKTGISSLTEDEMKMLPPGFSLGRDSYKERFREAAGAHCPQFENCFAAQSAWDDTMAWQATEFINLHPEQILVIIVGEFHAQFGGGLEDRLLARSPNVKVHTISQLWTDGMTIDEINQAMMPSYSEGPRADFIWISGSSQ